MKVLVSGPCNNITGYGKDTIELVQAFLRWGADVYLHPSTVHPPVPRDVAAVLTKPIPDDVDLLISHRCPQELANINSCGIWAASTVAVAWTMWEWDSLAGVDTINPNNCEHAFSVVNNIQSSLSRFDVVLAYDEVSAHALSPYHDNVSVLQGGVDPVLASGRDWFANPFKFLMAGALSTRKNPFVAINAFKRLRDAGELEHAELILKTVCTGLHPAMEDWCPGLKVIMAAWSEEKLFDLYRSCHVLLAPSWGEGKNRPAAEFAMTGGAVVAPHVGGHAQWMSPEYTWPVRYEWKAYTPGVFGADVSVDHLAEIMLDLYTNRSHCSVRADVASRVVPAIMNWDSVLERFMFRLPDLVGRRGVEVAALMQACRKGSTSLEVRDSEILGSLDGVVR